MTFKMHLILFLMGGFPPSFCVAIEDMGTLLLGGKNGSFLPADDKDRWFLGCGFQMQWKWR